jgi:HSP20 family protein
MSLIKYRSPSVLDDFRREINDLFNPTLSKTDKTGYLPESNWLPAVDIKENEKQYIVLADIPGVSSKDIDIFIDENNRLVLKGERTSETTEEKHNFVRIEREAGAFYRAFSLPDNIDANAISAKVKDGMMEVIIPKSNKATGRKIPVEG